LLKQISKNGEIPEVPSDVDMAKLGAVQHAQNFMRYRANRRKNDSAEEAEGSEGSDDE
jgi:hypothetical protein